MNTTDYIYLFMALTTFIFGYVSLKINWTYLKHLWKHPTTQNQDDIPIGAYLQGEDTPMDGDMKGTLLIMLILAPLILLGSCIGYFGILASNNNLYFFIIHSIIFPMYIFMRNSKYLHYIYTLRFVASKRAAHGSSAAYSSGFLSIIVLFILTNFICLSGYFIITSVSKDDDNDDADDDDDDDSINYVSRNVFIWFVLSNAIISLIVIIIHLRILCRVNAYLKSGANKDSKENKKDIKDRIFYHMKRAFVLHAISEFFMYIYIITTQITTIYVWNIRIFLWSISIIIDIYCMIYNNQLYNEDYEKLAKRLNNKCFCCCLPTPPNSIPIKPNPDRNVEMTNETHHSIQIEHHKAKDLSTKSKDSYYEH